MSFDPSVLPKEFREDVFDKFSSAEKAKWLGLRNKARKDLMFLSVDILGKYFQEIPHRELFNEFPQFDPESGKHFYELSPEIKKFMILWSRNTYKTTAVIMFLVQTLLNYPDLVIMIISGGLGLAQAVLKEAKSYFEHPTEKFAYLFPEYCNKKKLGSASEFTITCRTDPHVRMSSVVIGSAGSIKAGQHPDLLLVDDIVHEKNFRSQALLNKCMEDYNFLEPLLNPGGYVIVTGTRYTFSDPYEQIQQKAKQEMKALGKSIWKFSIKNCWKNQDKKQGVFFPAARTKEGKPIGHSMEFLEQMKQQIGPEMFSCQYENNPIAGGTQNFTNPLLDSVSLYHISQFPDPLICPCFFVGDLSYTGDVRRDSSVIFVCYLYGGIIYIRDCIAGPWGAEELTQQLFIGMMRYRPRVIWLEKMPAWGSYDALFRALASSQGIQRLPVEWVPGANTDGAKNARIAPLQSIMAQGRVRIFAGMPGYETLRQQLLQWPKSQKHEDYADALGWVFQVPTGYHMTALAPKNPRPSFLRDPEEAEPGYSDYGCGTGVNCGS